LKLDTFNEFIALALEEFRKQSGKFDARNITARPVWSRRYIDKALLEKLLHHFENDFGSTFSMIQLLEL
jgi:hypothetical protein